MKIWVIKAGGELLAEAGSRRRVLNDLRRHARLHPTVFVHGGGPQIEKALKASGIKIRYANGRRVTSPDTMDVVEKVLSGVINKSLAAQMSLTGCKAVGLSCRDGALMTGVCIPNLGRAAKPVAVRNALLIDLLKAGCLPIVCSVASDAKGEPVNVNADDAASALAVALKAENLIFLTDIQGVLDARKKRIPVLKIGQIDGLIADGVITGGMIPKVQSARAAIRKGVGKIRILNGYKGIRLECGTVIQK